MFSRSFGGLVKCSRLSLRESKAIILKDKTGLSADCRPALFNLGFNSTSRIFYSSDTSSSMVPNGQESFNERATLHPLLLQKAEMLENEYIQLSNELSSQQSYDSQKSTRLSRLGGIVERLKEYQSTNQEYDELTTLLKDPLLGKEAEAEISAVRQELSRAVQDLQGQLLPSNPFVEYGCMLEIRPGVGGIEAMIFANDLLQMYQNYALQKNWKSEIVTMTENPAGGITEAILIINQPGAYRRLQYEGGVHRVQRVPVTDSKGRVHTSTAAVVVLPQLNDDSAANMDETEKQFLPGEVRLDIMRARGAGGQHVNTTDSAVRLTHLATGIVVAMQDERSQHRNKAKAFMVLRARLAELDRQKKVQEEKNKRTAQVTTTTRSDKVRTYNYAQNRITDHRCGYTAHNLDECLSGDKLDAIIDEMDRFSQVQLMKEMLEE